MLTLFKVDSSKFGSMKKMDGAERVDIEIFVFRIKYIPNES